MCGFGDGTLERQFATREFADEFQQLGPVTAGEFLVSRLARTLDGLAKPVVIDGLQEVVECVRFERLERKFIVGGDENDDRHIAARQSPQDLEAVDARHLHVEEHNVRRCRPHCVDGFAAVPAFTADLDVVEIA